MTPNTDNFLDVRDLCSRYEGELLLNNVSFSLAEGEILCLLGPSGSGKTTLLKLIAGLERQYSGSILFRGADISPVAPYKRNFGMMFQEYALFPHQNVRSNIGFGLEMQRCAREERERRVEEALNLVGLGGLGHRNIDELSGGERQRVALARSLAPRPQLLLLDEPLGSLDRALRDRLTGEIRTILKQLGVTAIFVTHDQAEAFSVADKVGILHNGRLLQLESPESLYRRPVNTTVAAFLGFNNFIEGLFDGQTTFQAPFGPVVVDGYTQREQGEATLLIRPEGATLTGSSKVPQQNILAGKVLSRRFRGGRYTIDMEKDGMTFTFDLANDPPPPQPGEPIELAISPSALILLDKEVLS